MEESLVLETTFLIDLEREAGRRRSGPAHALLERQIAARLFLTPTIAGELAAGVSLAERSAWDAFLAPFPVLEITMEAAWQYGQVYRYLQAQGLLIGANDLWIAATSLAHGCALATRDVEHYQRVPGLRVVGYGD